MPTESDATIVRRYFQDETRNAIVALDIQRSADMLESLDEFNAADDRRKDEIVDEVKALIAKKS